MGRLPAAFKNQTSSLSGERASALPILRSFAEPSRPDRRWLQPLLVFAGLATFIVYARWAAFQNAHYYSSPYLSRFYSPELFGDAANQQAVITLLLAITDQLDEPYRMSKRQGSDLLPRLATDYQRSYYAGIISERKAKALLRQNSPGVEPVAHGLLTDAMRYYEEAERLRPAGNDDALLRWNTFARIIKRNKLVEAEQSWDEETLE